MLIALQFYGSDGLLQVVGDTTGVHKSTIHWHSIADAILETNTVLTHRKLHYGTLIVDRSYVPLRNMLKICHQASFARHFLKLFVFAWAFFSSLLLKELVHDKI